MRQLTSLDAQFLALETPRQYGHVAGLAVLDPSTAPGGSTHHNDRDVNNLITKGQQLLDEVHAAAS